MAVDKRCTPSGRALQAESAGAKCNVGKYICGKLLTVCSDEFATVAPSD